MIGMLLCGLLGAPRPADAPAEAEAEAADHLVTRSAAHLTDQQLPWELSDVMPES
jgi:hypothetical protein